MCGERAMSGEPITHDGEPRGYKVCECHVCGKAALCTPSFDFYYRTPGGPLECEKCFWENIEAQGNTRLPDITQ